MSRPSDYDNTTPLSAKLVISGGFGVGKTTLVGAVSEVTPFTTEEAMTEVAEGVDDRTYVEAKKTTTVAMDFGRITMDPTLVLFLFGTPGQDRFGFMWDELVTGALGAIILVDTRRIDECFPAIDYFEERSIPFAVAVNEFDNAPRHTIDEVREALDLLPETPVMLCDARERESVKAVLLGILELLLAKLSEGTLTAAV